MAREGRLTEGRVFPTLLRFSLPFFLANVLQALYGAADLAIVGQFSSSSAVSAVATGSQVMQTITGLAVGLTTGGTVLVGRAFGARDRRGLSNAVTAMICVFGLLSVVLTLGIGLMLDPICRLMHTPSEALASTRSYLFLCSTGVVFIVGYNAVSGVLRGLGDSRAPLLFVAVACAVNIGADLLLVGWLGMGAPGAAMATVAAQAIGLGLALLHLRRRGLIANYRSERVRIRARSAQELLQVGAPIAAQEALVNTSFLLITAIVNTMGVTASAALGVVEKLIVFSMLPTTAFASAVAAMTAQHLGAGLVRRSRSCLWAGVSLSLAFGAAFYLAAQLWGSGMIRLFSADPEVLRAGAAYLKSYSLDCVLVCFVFCLNSYFAGCGRSVFPLLHSLAATFLVRVPLSYVGCHTAGSMFAIGCAAPLATGASLVLCLWYLRRMSPRPMRQLA